jgi:hypothetical protein
MMPIHGLFPIRHVQERAADRHGGGDENAGVAAPADLHRVETWQRHAWPLAAARASSHPGRARRRGRRTASVPGEVVDQDGAPWPAWIVLANDESLDRA